MWYVNTVSIPCVLIKSIIISSENLSIYLCINSVYFGACSPNSISGNNFLIYSNKPGPNLWVLFNLVMFGHMDNKEY